MAGAGLVPHELPDGRVMMVPDYLVPQGLRLPEAPAPPTGPDLRTADASGMLGASSPMFRQVLDAGNAPPPAGAGMLNQQVVKPPEDAEQRAKRQDSERAIEGAKQAAAARANPAKLKQVPKPDPRHESSVVTDTAQAFYGKKPGGSGAPAKADPANLTPVVAEIKQERTPGVNLLPEQRWAMGLERRPSELYERDPSVPVSTIGTEDPAMREKLTPLEQGAQKYSQQGRVEFERQEAARHEMAVAQKQALIQQSELQDQQLDAIAARRSRIAELQALADKRGQEAESTEPKTRDEIWASKGSLAQGMGILAMALGGYAQARTGHNAGKEIIDSWLNGAVDDERYQYERKAKIGMQARNDFEKAVALYGDLDMAALDVKNRKIASTLAMTGQMMADKGLDETALQRGAAIQEQLRAQYLENARQLNDLAQGKVTKEEATLQPYGQVVQKATPKPVGGGGGSTGGVTGDKLKGLSKEIREMAVKMPDGRYKFVRSAQERIPMQARLNNAGAMIHNLRQLQALRADKSNTIPWGKKRGQIEAIGANLLALGKSKDQMGTLDKGLLEFSAKRYGDASQFNVVDNTIDGKLEENIRLLEDEVRKSGEYDLDNGPFELTEGGVTPDAVHE